MKNTIGKTQEKHRGAIFLAIEGERLTPVRMAKVVPEYTKDALRDFIKEWNDKFDVGLFSNEIDGLANFVWNDGEKWWWDETWCIQVYQD